MQLIAHCRTSYFESTAELVVEVLNGPGLVSGLRLVELPPHELDPVLHPTNLALKVGAVDTKLDS